MMGSSTASPLPSNVSEILKLKNDLKKANQQKFELLCDISEISIHFSDIVANMVVICMDLWEGRESIDKEMKQVVKILRSVNKKTGLRDIEQENIGSVLVDIRTISGIIRKLKLENATEPFICFDDDASDVGTRISSTSNGNDEQEPLSHLRGRSEKCSETDLFINDDEDDSDEDDDVDSIEAEKSPVNMASSPPAFLVGLKRTPSSNLRGPVMSTLLTTAQAKQLSANTSTSGEPRRRSGRLEKIPRKDYTYHEYDQIVKDHYKSLNHTKSRIPQSSQIQKDKKGNHVCPNSQCGERFSSLKAWTNHLINHASKDVGSKSDIRRRRGKMFGHRNSLEDEHGGRSSGNEFLSVGVYGDMLCTNGVTISVSRKRPKIGPNSTGTNQEGSILNRENDHDDGSDDR